MFVSGTDKIKIEGKPALKDLRQKFKLNPDMYEELQEDF